MKLKPITSNMTLLIVGDYEILFSYETPVAALHVGYYPGLLVTEKYWSRTTSRHINKWLDGREDITKKPQEYFDNLVSEVK